MLYLCKRWQIMRLTTANRKAIEYACKKFHYAKAVPVNTLGYNIYNQKDEWCGVVLYGTGANNNIANSFGLLQGQVLELVRVALNGKQECTSQAVALSLKQLRKDCPLCRLVVSYADCDQNHLGTIYQATNWIFVGTSMQNSADSSWVVNGKRYHGRIISDWVKARGDYADLHGNSSLRSIMTRMRMSLSRKASASISCRWIRRCASRLNRCASRIQRLMIIGKRLTALNSIIKIKKND